MLSTTSEMGIFTLNNPISFKSKILCGIAFEHHPFGWRNNNFGTIQSVDVDGCTLTTTLAVVMHVAHGEVYPGNSATYAVVIGI